MLELNQLSVSYGKKEVVKNLNVQFRSTSINGILGVNGAGKSTLFNTIYGIKKSINGTITLEGNPIQKSDIAYLQTENYFYPLMKGREYLQIIAPEKNFDKWNDIFQLPLEEFVEDYSTGMKKKIAFMGLILLDRPVYILDEPFNGVDIQSNEVLIRIIDALKKKGKYILVSSHILSSLLQMSDQIFHLQDGKFEVEIPKSDFDSFQTKFKKEIEDQVDDKLKNLDY